MSNERMPLGIEGAPTTKTSPVGIVILAIIIILACVAVYYYSPGLYESENEEGQGITATFNDVYSNCPFDSNNDGYNEYLNINVGVNVSEYGEYSVAGSLYIDNESIYASSTKYLSLGDNQTITLSFKGLSIYINRVNGPYAVKNLTLRIIKGNKTFKLDSRSYYNTSFYNYTTFQRKDYSEKEGVIIYHVEYADEIEGSSPDLNISSVAYKFDLLKDAIWVNLSGISAKDIDMYLYYSENEMEKSNNRDSGSETISIDKNRIQEIGYGSWEVLLHHYSSTTRPLNNADYTLVIDVVYE